MDVIRLNEGRPLIEADPNGWDNRFTLNPTALYLERSAKNDSLIKGLLGTDDLSDPALKNGVVAVYYRGVPHDSRGLPSCRSAVGLAVFTPDLQLIKRFPHPVIRPSDEPGEYDYNGVEDQRITRIGDTFYLVYCGFVRYSSNRFGVRICMAESKDMLNWEKLGPVEGDVNRWPNKDAVILPDSIDGSYIMLHRPSVGRQSDFGISLAVSKSPIGPWKDCGTVMRGVRHPLYRDSWVGMGSTPVSVGDGVYIADYHTGNYLHTGDRDYFANYALFSFQDFDPKRPESIVKSRSEGVLFPETRYERNSPWPHTGTLNCVFPCGSYEYKGDMYLIYGGADAYVLAAKVGKQELLEHSEELSLCKGRHEWSCPSLLETIMR